MTDAGTQVWSSDSGQIERGRAEGSGISQATSVRVPVLVDNDTVIGDSLAILVYLAHQYGDEDWRRICRIDGQIAMDGG